MSSVRDCLLEGRNGNETDVNKRKRREQKELEDKRERTKEEKRSNTKNRRRKEYTNRMKWSVVFKGAIDCQSCSVWVINKTTLVDWYWQGNTEVMIENLQRQFNHRKSHTEWNFICGARPATNRLSHDMATPKIKDTEKQEQNKSGEREGWWRKRRMMEKENFRKCLKHGKVLLKVP